MEKKLYACDACHFLFECEELKNQCPDCGKCRVRTATENEIAEFEARALEDNDE